MDESLLVRDTLYLMQGISGKYVRFSSLKEDEKNLAFGGDSVSWNLYTIYNNTKSN
jgi:gamma-tubulin complex component 3